MLLSFQNGLKMFNIFSVVMFVLCCYYCHVYSDDTANGALSVMPNEESEDDDVDVTIETAEEEIEYDPLNVFYPTKEWNTVKPGQAIPRGLHVRMNLATGEREAKLMESDTSKAEELKYWKDGERQGMLNIKEKKFSRNELKQALKHFKTEQFTEKKADGSAVKFRSYKDLKKDFEDMNINMKTDMEVITELVQLFNSSGVSAEKKISILTELEYYLHQIDNGKLFCDIGGMNLLAHSLNDTDADIRIQTAFVLGSALQSNPKVQISAIENGVMQQLIRILSIERSDALRKKVIYALSSLIRHFPFAQKKFIELGGLTAFGRMLGESGLEKLKVKIVTLIQDLVLEKDSVIKYSNTNDSVQRERLKQYNEILLTKHLLDLGWCEKIPLLLEVHDHDIQEKVLAAMNTLMDTCQQSFRTSVSILKKLKEDFESQYSDSEEDDYLISLTKLVTSVIDNIHVQIKEEL